MTFSKDHQTLQSELGTALARELGLSGPAAEVRGASALSRPAPLSRVALAYLGNFSLSLLCVAFAANLAGKRVTLAPHALWFAAVIPIFLLVHVGSRLLFPVSPGEFFQGFSRTRDGKGRWNWLDAPLLPEKPGKLRWMSGIFLTAIGFTASLLAVNQAFFLHPLWLQAAEIHEDALAPSASADWSVMPFFYAVGSWPSSFGGKPVLYSFPYEKGPPSHFAGHLIARWDSPHVLLSIEGPKTPKNRDDKPYSRDELRRCLREWIPIGCQSLRETHLARHVAEISRALGGGTLAWTLQWRIISNFRLPQKHETQGIFLRARREGKSESRFIAVSPLGNQQMISLKASGESEELAQETFSAMIRSLRLTDDLTEGRAWINERLRTVEIRTERESSDVRETARALAEAQALLLSKISVEPAVFDSYYHLGGTAFRLFQLAQGAQDLSAAPEWSAAARPLLESAARYARDVSANDSRNSELERLVAFTSGTSGTPGPSGNPRRAQSAPSNSQRPRKD